MTHTRSVVVIGAGIIGSTLARELARRGAKVTLVDKGHPGEKTTDKSFAWLNSQAHFRNTEGITDEAARKYYELQRLALGHWRKLDREINGLGIRWEGLLSWCTPGSPDEETMRGEMERRLQWGSPARWLNRDGLREILPSAQIGEVGLAFFGDDEGHLDPVSAVSALTADCVRLGVDLRLECEFLGFRTQGDDVVGVDLSDGILDCDDVVLAAGVNTPTFASSVGIDVPLKHSLGALVHLAPMPTVIGPVVHSPKVHAVQRYDGRTVISRHFGGTPVEEYGELNPDELLKDAMDVFPIFQTARVEKVTTGERVLPSDGLPIVGKGANYTNVRTVSSNAGVTLAPLLAQFVAAELMEDMTVHLLEPFRATRFLAAH